jgi:hypothetical protein
MGGPMSKIDEFRDLISAFIAKRDMPKTTFGKLALGDPSFINDLEQGRSPSLGTIEKVEQFIAEQSEAAQ